MDKLKNCRILILEENAQVAQLLEEMLKNFECKVVGPFMDVQAALIATNSNVLDAAILDVKVKGKTTRELADELAHKGVPFVFVSGNQSPSTLKKFSPTLVITKPYAAENIYKVLCEMIQSRIL